jgi:TonB family protein
MHRTISFLAVLILAGSLAAQTKSVALKPAPSPSGDFDFSGATLRISIDSMTDRQVCSITTRNNGAWIAVSGDSVAIIATMKNRNVDYDRPAFLRVGDAPPFRLGISRRPHFLAIPFEQAPEVVRALYTQQRVRLRFTEWPDGANFDEQLEAGDFAAAYDRGVELCAWPKLSIAGVHPPVETASAAPLEERSISIAGANAARCIYCPSPELSAEERGAGYQGTVVLSVTITSDGRVVAPVVVKDPSMYLGERAIAAVRDWKMRPAISSDGWPVESSLQIEVAFR